MIFLKKYIAYPFLYDDPSDLKCDFEILTDELASMIGLLRAFVNQNYLRDELEKINELVYHLNPSLRIFYKSENENLVKRFVIPQGGICSGYCHVIRSKFKSVVRLLYRHKQNGNEFDNILFNFFNLLSGYFFALAIKFNKDEGIAEKEFISKNY